MVASNEMSLAQKLEVEWIREAHVSCHIALSSSTGRPILVLVARRTSTAHGAPLLNNLLLHVTQLAAPYTSIEFHNV